MSSLTALTPLQISSVQATMSRHVNDDLARGVSPARRLYCGGCQSGRPMPGFRDYGKHALCSGCAAEYEVACLRGAVATIGQYVRDKRFGEETRHALATLLLDGGTV